MLVYLTEEPEQVQSVPTRPAVRFATPSQKMSTLFFAVAMTLGWERLKEKGEHFFKLNVLVLSKLDELTLLREKQIKL